MPRYKPATEVPNLTNFPGFSLVPEEKETCNSNNCKQCCGDFWSNITVEPYLLLSIIAFSIGGVFSMELMVEKTCLNKFNYSVEICSNLDSSNNTVAQNNVQRFTAELKLYQQLIISVPTMFYALLIGSWSDRYGRKIPLILPPLGSIASRAIHIVNVYYFSLPPEYFLLGYIPVGILGGLLGKFMAVWSYMSDVTEDESRTFRISLIHVFTSAIIPAGYFFSTYIFDYLDGFFGIFGAQIVMYVLSLLYVCFCIKNVDPSRIMMNGSRRGREERDDQGDRRGWVFASDEAEATQCSTCSQALRPANMRQTLQTFCRPRPNYDRAQIVILVLCNCILLIRIDLKNFLYLFTRKKFAWDYHDYNLYALVDLPVELVGSLAVLPVLCSRFQPDDRLLCLVGAASFSLYFLTIGLAQEPWHMYLASALAIGTNLSSIGAKGALTKLVAPNETGSIFAVITMFEAILPNLSSPTLTFIYNMTLDYNPGVIYLVGCGVFVCMCISFATLMVINNKRINYQAI